MKQLKAHLYYNLGSGEVIFDLLVGAVLFHDFFDPERVTKMIQ